MHFLELLNIVSPQHMRRRVIVVVWSVCLSVCLCVIANLGIYADRHQMMSTNGINVVWRSFKKRCFTKNALFKSYGIIYILRQRQQPYCVFMLMVTCPYAKEANEMLSSTSSRSK